MFVIFQVRDTNKLGQSRTNETVNKTRVFEYVQVHPDAAAAHNVAASN